MDKYEAEGMVFEIREKYDLLTKWEEDFLISIEDAIEQGITLTTKQEDTLDEIYRRVIG